MLRPLVSTGLQVLGPHCRPPRASPTPSPPRQIPEYHSLEWRLQVCTAGRHVRAGEMAPNFLLRLHTRAPAAANPHASHLLQANAARACCYALSARAAAL